MKVYAIMVDDPEIDPYEMSDAQIVEHTKETGLYWDLDEFSAVFNQGGISDEWYIRIF